MPLEGGGLVWVCGFREGICWHLVYVKITLSQLFDKYMTFSQVCHTLTAMLQAVHM